MTLKIRTSTGDALIWSLVRTTWDKESYYNELLRQKSTNYKYPKLCSPLFGHFLNEKEITSQESSFSFLKPNIIKNLRWSKDGNTLVSVNEDFGIRLYVLPEDLDNEEGNGGDRIPKMLFPLNRAFERTSILAHDLNPGFSLYDQDAYLYNLNNMIISERQLPLKLLSLVPHDSEDFEGGNIQRSGQAPVISNYHFRDKENDRYFDSYSLKFVNENHFLAGAKNHFAVFNLDYTEPTVSFKLSNLLSGNNKKFGIVSTMENMKLSATARSLSQIYLGSYLNNFAAIDLNSMDIICNKNLGFETKLGDGIYQILESDNLNYVYVLSRRSNSIPILDNRMGYSVVDEMNGWQGFGSSGWLTNQKCFGDVLHNNQGVVVGDQTGQIKWWKDAALGIGGAPETLLEENEKLVRSFDTNMSSLDSDTVGHKQRNAVSSVKVNPIEGMKFLAFAQGSSLPAYEDTDDEDEKEEKGSLGVYCFANGMKVAEMLLNTVST